MMQDENKPTFEIKMNSRNYLISVDLDKSDGEQFACDDPRGQEFVRNLFATNASYRFSDEQVVLDFVKAVAKMSDVRGASWVSNKPIAPPFESVEGRIY